MTAREKKAVEMWTKLEAANKLLFQWFFVRLTKSYDEYWGDDDPPVPKGTYGWCLQYWIVPLSGWGYRFWGDYKSIGKIKISKRILERVTP